MKPAQRKLVPLVASVFVLFSSIAIGIYAYANESGHTSFNPLGILLPYTLIFVWSLRAIFRRNEMALFGCAAAISLLAASFVIYLDRTNTLVEYHEWVQRGMPEKGQAPAKPPLQSSKIEFDLSALDADGLRGPADGKVAVSYEFAIPNTEACKNEVHAIDPTVEFMPGSPGRIQAGADQCLCIGHTHQPNFSQVLAKLSALPYVERIQECHFE